MGNLEMVCSRMIHLDEDALNQKIYILISCFHVKLFSKKHSIIKFNSISKKKYAITSNLRLILSRGSLC